MEKIFIYIHQSALKGGVEKVFYNLFNNLPNDLCKITVLNYCAYISNDIYDVRYKGQRQRYWFYYDEWSTNPVKKFLQRVHNKIMPIILPAWLKLQSFDIAIAAQEGMYAKFVVDNIKAKKKFLWVHNDMMLCRFTEKYFASPEEEKEYYEKFDGVACVSDSVRKTMIERFGAMNNLSVVYNPVDTNEIDNRIKVELPKRSDKTLFLCVGRLVDQKGFDRLLPICKRLNDEGFQYVVWILGEGPDRNKLESYIKDHSLKNVKLLGYQSNPFIYMRDADWLLCTSRHEGFNMVLHEAIWCETAVITTDNAGARELLGDSEYGIVLDNNVDAIYNGLKRVLEDSSLKDRYVEMAKCRKSFVSLDGRMNAIMTFLEGGTPKC